MAKIPARWSSRDKLGTVDFEWIAKSISRTGIRPLTHPPEGASTRTAATRLRVIGIGVLVGQRRDARSVDGDDSAAIYKSAVPSLTLVPYSWWSLRGLSVSSRSPLGLPLSSSLQLLVVSVGSLGVCPAPLRLGTLPTESDRKSVV